MVGDAQMSRRVTFKLSVTSHFGKHEKHGAFGVSTFATSEQNLSFFVLFLCRK